MRPQTAPATRRVATLTLERPAIAHLDQPAAPACRPVASARRATRRPAWRLRCVKP
ncbi:hypothetical protein RB614_33345 [Phytohabitans sp. ZYX-F-186]|uniref:Uncharacterized protein n=1 Tax=Phytohabitans maris TaxID=3071409 RepID=A0ABU0ZQW8_9ACTN|nr:hypothetical protein [Phytohabitans sp. ZYX-F-186]MDQ7909420.1 hypothetical protein [Phytohabitans sp. ZYX-F-186]